MMEEEEEGTLQVGEDNPIHRPRHRLSSENQWSHNISVLCIYITYSPSTSPLFTRHLIPISNNTCIQRQKSPQPHPQTNLTTPLHDNHAQ
jgi:hypothetical protein